MFVVNKYCCTFVVTISNSYGFIARFKRCFRRATTTA